MKVNWDHRAVQRHFDAIARDYDSFKQRRSYYFEQLIALYRERIANPRTSSILEVGCGTGALLAALNPLRGTGIDLSQRMVEIARQRWADLPHLRFHPGNILQPGFADPHDITIAADVLEHVPDIPQAFLALAEVVPRGGRLIVSTANHRWKPLLEMLEKFRCKMPEGPHRWPRPDEIKNAAAESGFLLGEEGSRCLLPGYLRPFSVVINRSYFRWPGFKYAGLIRFFDFVNHSDHDRV